ncbi:signal recognition particle receptor protein [Listeria phage 20422-1]|uniref:Uncharacterized protein n=3 Tax=Pecentumvirus TaxID=1857844 RepID=A0A060AFW4_9CAUD|nr:hypothetical protein HH39_gp165 [Listeria phage LMSP-25]YP_009616211.1 hypothetical protein FDI77_gp165 [Listeria phage LMTA-34]YP_009793436.1 hypothetical protein QLX42_gp133 [Listeria phage LMTA-57]AIA64451.1 hypothetical protein [Listeria phage LMSP-25]AID17009.1 hypothetical protein [Listeria phage LMTA-34]AID17587.1 hypothetical protein [Listeria phage LMTA-57]
MNNSEEKFEDVLNEFGNTVEKDKEEISKSTEEKEEVTDINKDKKSEEETAEEEVTEAPEVDVAEDKEVSTETSEEESTSKSAKEEKKEKDSEEDENKKGKKDKKDKKEEEDSKEEKTEKSDEEDSEEAVKNTNSDADIAGALNAVAKSYENVKESQREQNTTVERLEKNIGSLVSKLDSLVDLMSERVSKSVTEDIETLEGASEKAVGYVAKNVDSSVVEVIEGEETSKSVDVEVSPRDEFLANKSAFLESFEYASRNGAERRDLTDVRHAHGNITNDIASKADYNRVNDFMKKWSK